MPRYVRPAHGELLEAAIDAFGANRARIAILRYIRESGPATRGEVADAVGLGVPTTYSHLSALREDGVLIADPTQDEAIRGQRIRYSINETRLAELYIELGRALGQA